MTRGVLAAVNPVQVKRPPGTTQAGNCGVPGRRTASRLGIWIHDGLTVRSIFSGLVILASGAAVGLEAAGTGGNDPVSRFSTAAPSF